MAMTQRKCLSRTFSEDMQASGEHGGGVGWMGLRVSEMLNAPERCSEVLNAPERVSLLFK